MSRYRAAFLYLIFVKCIALANFPMKNTRRPVA